MFDNICKHFILNREYTLEKKTLEKQKPPVCTQYVLFCSRVFSANNCCVPVCVQKVYDMSDENFEPLYLKDRKFGDNGFEQQSQHSVFNLKQNKGITSKYNIFMMINNY